MRTIQERAKACINGDAWIIENEMKQLRRDCAQLCFNYQAELKKEGRDYEAIAAGECGLLVSGARERQETP